MSRPLGELDLTGWVVVVAGEAGVLAQVARTAVSAGAAVGLVSATLDDSAPATVRFRADPRDPGAWERIAMHLEQHLGPIDGVVTDARAAQVLHEVFGHDLRRRGRQPIRVVSDADSADAVVTSLCDMPPAASSPP